uniref:Sulfhydryl oxidase n=1 Tax=Haptolina brevifila TaxID=156173 RepID=A0A7S2D2E8_9EUKA|mmetsp:Transcript_32049/g.63974  ORF Transcript_32049/g.63974 Transcript_32049/m.63974 type:complete len:165 (+) Transcript_32049:89-583(+)|eukprot:CAMPEP_0174695156 /NCGR_PEP_ID=MMETSP1094-20130205/1598_1 /TAXON_ID=156173 /ORGANISM="Chrysochromulina brevifilum, Strain UTEX LB 985" /LENGTH=164 /DNA_ID=CAMNT_0015891587 /DNA_START=72 /DNA_END=566 /DNA_ORIENTATION=-
MPSAQGPTQAPCPDPACASKSDAMKMMFEAAKPLPAAASATAVAPCPPDRDELGRHSWTLLHTMAAYFPDKPSSVESATALGFIRAIGVLYPCRHCATEFQAGLEESPPRANSRAELSVWLCEAHNRVNRLLGKPEFKCSVASLDARWRKGDVHCDYAGIVDDE